MYISNYKISDPAQEQLPFIRISTSGEDSPWISMSDGTNGMAVVFENREEFEKFFNERREILGEKVTTKISCTKSGGC